MASGEPQEPLLQSSDNRTYRTGEESAENMSATNISTNDSQANLTSAEDRPVRSRGSRRRPANEPVQQAAASSDHHEPDEQERQQMAAEELKYGAKHFIKLFPPITACMILTIILLKVAPHPPSGSTSAGVVLFAESDSNGWEDNLIAALKNVGIVVAAFVIMTILLVVLYKYRCYCILKGWFTFAIFLIFFILFTITIITILVQLDIALDYMSVFFFIWNIGVLGVMSILWQAPLPVRQTYHILVCALISFTLVRMLPSITTWVLLAALVVWDLIAVLTPCGPLRKLIELAQQRNEQESGVFNSIIYSTAIAYGSVGTEDPISENSNVPPEPAQRNSAHSDRAREVQAALNGSDEDNRVNRSSPHSSDNSEDERGVKLGLGDFVFYSVLIARATEDSADWNTTMACFLAILVGLCFTLILLAIWKHALPALPISLTFGLIFYFGTSQIISPFTESLAMGERFRVSIVTLCLFSILYPVDSLIFFVEPNVEKCIRDEVHKDVLVTGDYAVLGDAVGHVIDIKVTDSRQQTLHKKANIQKQKGKFTITVDQFDVLQICFKSTVQHDNGNTVAAEISLDLKHGIETKAYEQIAEAEKLKPMEVELKKLEDLAESIVRDFTNMKQAEEEMRDTNESTHSRVLYFSLFSVFCLLGLACWQVLYLRQYFKRQKLID